MAQWRIGTAVICALMIGALACAGEDRLRIEEAQMAGMSGFRTFWDRPVVIDPKAPTKEMGISRGKDQSAIWTQDGQAGASVFDAVHRSLLIRFPAAAEAIHAALKEGKTIAKAELFLPFLGTEMQSELYNQPTGQYFLGDAWEKIVPRWHAQAWALRKPWASDMKTGPTFNAAINGAVYWAKYGAQDEAQDRFPAVFGPAEVSAANPEGRMDVTAMLTDAAFGATAGERLRRFSDCGVLVRKEEAYDAAFYRGGYDYQTTTGHRGIRIAAPVLEITFAKGKADAGTLPAPADVKALAATKAGAPTAVVPADAEIARFVERFAARRPADMPEWQWTKVQELLSMGEGGHGNLGAFPSSKDEYLKWLDMQLAFLPRTFPGFEGSTYGAMALLYADAIPAPVMDHWKLHWRSILVPDQHWSAMAHGYVGSGAVEYYKRTGDWRGNYSLYRTYSRSIGTMNFNCWSTAATLFGGLILADDRMIAEGRYGLEMWNLRLWSWVDGTVQESIDHYYFAESIAAQKQFAETAPAGIDRMIGESTLAKSMEEIVTAYHPGLRRIIASGGRTGTGYILGHQDGLYYMLHLLSKKGVLTDVGVKELPGGIEPQGQKQPAAKLAQMALNGPWGPAWYSSIIDDKPLPFELTSAFTRWGNLRERPFWHRTYMGLNYGVASLDDTSGNEMFPYMAQWRRKAEDVTSAFQIGTMLARFGWNDTDVMDSVYHGNPIEQKNANANGGVGEQGGYTAQFQSGHTTLILGSPREGLRGDGGRPKPEKITSLQTSLALFSLEETPSWEIFIDGKKVTGIPAQATETSVITIKDGVTFIGIRPIPSTDLGRTKVIEIRDGGPLRHFQGGSKTFRPSILINNYQYYSETDSIDEKKLAARIDKACGGFAVEVADVNDFPAFEAFQAHMAATTVTVSDVNADWESPKVERVVHLEYQSGSDRFAADYRPVSGGAYNNVDKDRPTWDNRTVNGAWPYLPKGIDRDTTVSQQGFSGLLQKNGAILIHQPGCMGYLVTDVKDGITAFRNPLPDVQYMDMSVPGGIRVRGDGKLGMLDCVVNRPGNAVTVTYAIKPEQTTADMASALFVFGCASAPAVSVNGRAVAGLLAVTVDGQTAWRVPLFPEKAAPSPAEAAARFMQAMLPQLAAQSSLSQSAASLRSDRDVSYMLTQPRSGTYNFQCQWPLACVFEAVLPGGARVASDGAVHLMQLMVSPSEGTLLCEYPAFTEKAPENPGEALLVFGIRKLTQVDLMGVRYAGEIPQVTIDGETAWVIPLGEKKAADVAKTVVARYQAARARISAPKE